MRSTLILWVLCAGALPSARGLVGADCNGNGIEDALDVLPGGLGFPAISVRAVERYPGPVEAADWNGDGWPDLALRVEAGENSRHSAAILLNSGGKLEAGEVFPLERKVVALAAAELNGDGFMDLACADQESSTVVLLLGGGDGTLRPGTIHTVGARPVALQAVDLDADGDDDLVSADQDGKSLTVLLQGSGVLSRSGYVLSIQPAGVACLDADGDGNLDMAAAGAVPDTLDASVAVLLGDGKGSFSHARGFSTAAFPLAILAGDLDGDGGDDLVTAHPGLTQGSGFISFHRGNGRNEFDPPVDSPSRETPWSVRLVDLDADGLEDIAFTSEAFLVGFGSLSVIRNLGSGRFGPAIEYAAGEHPRHLASLDLDRDGFAELAVTNSAYEGTVTVFSNDGTSLNAAPQYPSSHGVLSLALGDLDRDGALDLVTSGNDPEKGTGALSFHRNDGNAGFEKPLRFLAGKMPVDVLLADFNADGFNDAAVADQTLGQVIVIENTGDELLVSEAHAVGPHPSSVAAVDVDRDGDIDIAAAVLGPLDASCRCHRADGAVVILRNGGGGTFGSPETLPVPCCPAGLHAVDLDSDGDADLVAANGGGESGSSISVLRNDSGGFAEITSHPMGGRPLEISAADLDGDSDPDLLLTIVGGAPAILWNTGTGSFEEERLGALAQDVLAADLDGDGSADLALAGGVVSVARNLGRRRFEAPVAFPVGSPAGLLGALDLDNDGFLDLVSVHQGSLDYFGCGCYRSASISVLINQARPPASIDADGDRIPDECIEGFRRGDSDSSGTTDLTDAIFTLTYLFLSGSAPSCLEAADSGNDGRIDIADPILVLDHLFRGGPAPPAPGPGPGPCGPDTDFPGSVADLGCDEYGACRG